MPFNNQIDRTGAASLIPEVVSGAFLTETTEASAVMRLAKKLPNMSTNQTRMPVVASLPVAYFNGGDSGLGQTTEVSWSDKYINAEELDVILPIPKAVLDDANFDIWGMARPLLIEAFGVAIDNAVTYGTNIPAAWTSALGGAGLVAVATAASQAVSLAAYADLYEALLGQTVAKAKGVLMLLEADGFLATGHVAHTSMRGEMRNCRDLNGNPIFAPGQNVGSSFSTGTLDGAPIVYPLNGTVDSSKSLLVSGAWNQLVYAMRQDVTWQLSDQATITDAQGKVIFNLFQQNMIALKATMRLGFALPNPINRMNQTAATRCPFAVLTA